MNDVQRELTRQEKVGIRKLVKRCCANYDREYGCLPLDWDCYMFGKCYTGSFCKYFRNAVLPLDAELEASLAQKGGNRVCGYCGAPFQGHHKQLYCSESCAAAIAKNRSTQRAKKYRQNKR